MICSAPSNPGLNMNDVFCLCTRRSPPTQTCAFLAPTIQHMMTIQLMIGIQHMSIVQRQLHGTRRGLTSCSCQSKCITHTHKCRQRNMQSYDVDSPFAPQGAEELRLSPAYLPCRYAMTDWPWTSPAAARATKIQPVRSKPMYLRRAGCAGLQLFWHRSTWAV